ncbi:MAG: hypothetical protein KGQ42_05215, partial [Alphaproteobacteria bacterium]|nr:hypothetical protein [Alphaproteobacteria bacterium]
WDGFSNVEGIWTFTVSRLSGKAVAEITDDTFAQYLWQADPATYGKRVINYNCRVAKRKF